MLAALCCLRGQAYANLDNRPRAAVWLRTALEIDARCVEALHCLTRCVQLLVKVAAPCRRGYTICFPSPCPLSRSSEQRCVSAACGAVWCGTSDVMLYFRVYACFALYPLCMDRAIGGDGNLVK